MDPQAAETMGVSVAGGRPNDASSPRPGAAAYGRPFCPNCLVSDPANLEICLSCGRRRIVGTRTRTGLGLPRLPGLQP